MSQRRMTSLDIVDTDAFLDMPQSSQLLYFHLNARADDDGFIANPKRIMRDIGSQIDDMKLLISKKFLIAFEDGVIVIKHWRINNYIRKDIYKETKYIDHKQTLFIRPNGAYTLTADGRAIQVPKGHFQLNEVIVKNGLSEPQNHVHEASTESALRLGKVRLGKDSINMRDQVAHGEPFNQDTHLQRILKEDKNRHIRLIARFLIERRKRYGTPDFLSKEEINATIPRYVRAAKQVAIFGNEKILEAVDKAFEKVGNETTLETVYKYLTK